MKIAYFSYLYDIKGVSAGSANKAIGFMGGLKKLGHETKLFWRGYQPKPGAQSFKNQDSILKKKLRKFYLEPKKLITNIRHLFQENRILDQFQPDVVISRLTLYTFSNLFLCQRKKIPLVIEADCPPIYENNNFYGKDNFHLNYAAEFIEQQNLIKADAIIVLSNILKDYFIQKGIPEHKMHVVPNGADPEKFSPREKDAELAQQFKIGDNLVIGWIGSLAGEWSGIVNLIEMAVKVLQTKKNVMCLFVGGGKNKQRFEAAFRENGVLDRVILPGTVPYDEIPRYLSLMDIVIAPYPKLKLWYPSSMKLFEYMSSGKAVVASAVGQITEIIQQGENGYLFDPDEKEGMLNKVLLLVNNPEKRKMIGEKARKTVLEKYTWEHHAKTIEKILFDVVKEKNVKG